MATTSIFASQQNTFSSSLLSATVSSGGNTTQSFTRWVWIQGLTRGGLNLQTALGQKTINTGEQLTVSLDSALPNGCDTMGIVISFSEDSSAVNSRIVGIIWLRDKNQTTERSLPASLVFSRDEHFAVNGSVTATANLSSVNPINGLIRYVTNESLYYLYDAEGWLPESQNTIGWMPLTASENGTKTRGNQCYLTSTKTPRPNSYLFGGCDCPIASLTENSSIDIPYGWESGTETLPIKIWILNEDNPINNRKFILNPTIDKDPVLGQERLTENTTITPNFIIDYDTGIVDEILSNTPITYKPTEPFYRLTSQLNAEKAIEFEIVTNAVIGLGQKIDFNINAANNTGTSIIAPTFGSSILPETSTNPKFFRCLPTLIEKGMGIYQIPDSINAYYFNYTTTQGYTGLVANTSDQIVLLNAQQNGECRVVQGLSSRLSTEAIRAVISTESGVQSASEGSNTISLAENDQLVISFSHPSSIRSNYPDVIAGTDSTFLIDSYIIELDLDGSSYYFSNYSPALTPENIAISSISGVSTTPPTVNSDNDFGLFELTGLTISVNSGQGTLPATTTAKIRIYQVYGEGTTLSKISHSTALGCISETTSSFSEVSNLAGKVQVTANDTNGNYLRSKIIDSTEIIATLNNAGGNETLSFTPLYYRPPIATKAALKALPVASLLEGTIRMCFENNSPYIYRVTIPSADDNDNYLESDDGTTQGWVKAGGQSGGSGGLTQTASIASLKAIANGTVSDNQLFQVTGTGGIYQRFNGRTNAESSPLILRPNDYNTVNAVYVRLNIFDETGNLLINSDNITEGTTKLFLISAERTKLDNLATNANSTYAAQTTQITGTNGLSGGGNLSTNQTLSLNINGLTEETSVATNDTVAIYDTSATAHRKVQLSNLGIQGWNAWAQTSTSIDWGNTIFPVQLTLTNGENTGFQVGQLVEIFASGNGYKMLITAKSGTNLITINKDTANYTYPSTGTLNNGILTPTGTKGNDGAQGIAGSIAAFNRSDTPNTVSVGEAALRVKLTEDKAFIDLESTQKELPFFDAVKDAVLTGFSASTATAILATDTIIQALQKVQKYLTDYLTNFNGANQLLKLDANGKIPAVDGALLILPQPISIKGTITDTSTEELFIFPKSGTVTKIEYLKTSDVSSSVTFKINSTDVTGLSSLAVSTTPRGVDTASANNTFNAGDSLKVYNSGSDLTDLYFVIYYQFS
jgi:hypothetical protein